MTRPLVIYHGNCPDGFTAAWLIHRWLWDQEDVDAELVAARYQEAPPDVTDRRVWVVDFCYETEHLDRIYRDTRQLVILDHHQTAAAWIAQSSIPTFVDVPNLPCESTWDLAVVNQERSGAGLAKLYVGSNDAFVDYIEDRDLWRFALAETAQVFAAVTSHPYTLEAWDQIAETPLEDLIREGEAINRYRGQLIDQTIATAHRGEVCGVEMPVVASPYAIGSDVAGVLAADDAGGVAAYYVDYGPERRRYGLRSTPIGPDVAALAEPFGGGGHKHAAGFEVRS